MAKISELAEYYKEEVIKRVLQGTLIDSSGLKIKEGLFLYFQEQSVDAGENGAFPPTQDGSIHPLSRRKTA